MRKVHNVYKQFREYMDEEVNKSRPSVAYFCMEFGLNQVLKIYSGGLGMLAGDYLKEASDSNVDLCGVGLLYRFGYFTQSLSMDGQQIAKYDAQYFNALPIERELDANGNQLVIDIPYQNYQVHALVWHVNVGRIKLYLLDTDNEMNSEYDRPITHNLYGGDNENRLKQEILLGIGGTLMALVMVMYSYLGIEIIGVTAGEAHDPKSTIKKAIDEVFWRILIFYVLSLGVIMAIYPWDEIGHLGSPFVITFEKLGIAGAADIINIVVITAVLSSCNSGIFSSGRMLYNLSLQGNAPSCFQRLNRHRLPWIGILFSAAVLLFSVLMNYIMPAQVFVYVTSVGSFGALFTWFVILRTQQKFRAALSPEEKKLLTYKMPFAPWSGYLTMLFLLGVVVASAFRDDTRVALYVTPVWFAILLIGYHFIEKNKRKHERKSGSFKEEGEPAEGFAASPADVRMK